eukprot:CAMPEP_0115035460 /NCGR_PEP_ID=MMETSP0216-20121206/41460_1 /TAXON_ID=223996 /ORGANISM="Protocruzia adherens, Strain Boccale" /LENGTH=746 /DNA_ID=CAMNT_0002414941 /DNA_START=37 /DNA_END=2277 /DNA_ORIENTATION=+
MNWLRRRYKKASPNYMMLPQELKKAHDVQKVFKELDEDGSNSLEITEIFNMFKANKIEIPIEKLRVLFKTVSNGESLNLEEFKAFVNDEEANRMFRQLMKEYKFKVDMMEREEDKPEFIPMSFNVMLNYLILKDKRESIHNKIESGEYANSEKLISKFKKLFSLPLATDQEIVKDKKAKTVQAKVEKIRQKTAFSHAIMRRASVVKQTKHRQILSSLGQKDGYNSSQEADDSDPRNSQRGLLEFKILDQLGQDHKRKSLDISGGSLSDESVDQRVQDTISNRIEEIIRDARTSGKKDANRYKRINDSKLAKRGQNYSSQSSLSRHSSAPHYSQSSTNVTPSRIVQDHSNFSESGLWGRGNGPSSESPKSPIFPLRHVGASKNQQTFSSTHGLNFPLDIGGAGGMGKDSISPTTLSPINGIPKVHKGAQMRGVGHIDFPVIAEMVPTHKPKRRIFASKSMVKTSELQHQRHSSLPDTNDESRPSANFELQYELSRSEKEIQKLKSKYSYLFKRDMQNAAMSVVADRFDRNGGRRNKPNALNELLQKKQPLQNPNTRQIHRRLNIDSIKDNVFKFNPKVMQKSVSPIFQNNQGFIKPGTSDLTTASSVSRRHNGGVDLPHPSSTKNITAMRLSSNSYAEGSLSNLKSKPGSSQLKRVKAMSSSSMIQRHAVIKSGESDLQCRTLDDEIESRSTNFGTTSVSTIPVELMSSINSSNVTNQKLQSSHSRSSVDRPFSKAADKVHAILNDK